MATKHAIPAAMQAAEVEAEQHRLYTIGLGAARRGLTETISMLESKLARGRCC